MEDNISEKIVAGDEKINEYIDDYRSLGLIYEAEGGYSYPRRVFLLLDTALKNEEKVAIPERFPPRAEIADYAKSFIWDYPNGE